ncbi:kinase [Bacteroidales bacterium]|nr:kinase [Bacteroidales bacterium]
MIHCFHEIAGVSSPEWFCTSDPIGERLGSGAGTSWLLESCRKEENPKMPFEQWLPLKRRILLHAGGQSRRLPSYAPSGKILTPIPVFRWARGQKLNQNLLSLQVPLYEKIMAQAPKDCNTLIVSGDVYIHHEKNLPAIPQADLVCYGLWVDPSLASNHGVFVSSRKQPNKLDFMLQKPKVKDLGTLTQSHFFLMDIGIWLLSDRAMKLLMKRSLSSDGKKMCYYDLYADFGLSLGDNPTIIDTELNELSVAIIPLEGGQFYHYGTSRELISSTLAIQNIEADQRLIMQRGVKPHPAIFIQNAALNISLSAENSEVWIENACIGKKWHLKNQHIITGIPQNDWAIELQSGQCLDIIPIAENSFAARPYGFSEPFKGDINASSTIFMGMPIDKWFAQRDIDPTIFFSANTAIDIQQAELFPVCHSMEDLETVIRWMLNEPFIENGRKIWTEARRMSANDLSDKANLKRLIEQRKKFQLADWSKLAQNHKKSVFYQLNLADAAEHFAKNKLELPDPLSEHHLLMNRIHDLMFRSNVHRLLGKAHIAEEDAAFHLLRESLIASVIDQKQNPCLSIFRDQIVWSRSPARIDLAGGWTDTPPYCLYSGGNVVNIAIELNGQAPLQVYVKPCNTFHIVLRSIDLGAREEIYSYHDLQAFNKVGSPFSIPKAALALAGFSAQFGLEKFDSLEEQLKNFGSGIEITLLAAIPAGSGLGTSSILAATTLGAISDFCGLAWDKNEICRRTLVLEQLLTTGGGWQDQYGGILQGVKLLQTDIGFDQNPQVRWLPEHLFTEAEYAACHLLFYTGITRTAKDILAEIVRGMFLNNTEHLNLLAEMKAHALDTSEAIQKSNFDMLGRAVGKTWTQNKGLDCGTNPPAIEALISQIKDYTLGYKLPGAGGGGYLYIIAKDPNAAFLIRKILTNNSQHPNARFVEMSLSKKGMQSSRS